MKKIILFLSVFIALMQNIIVAQNTTITKSQSSTLWGIKDYLQNNILDLNPIEGIYAVNYSFIQSSFLYSNPNVFEVPLELAIVNTSFGLQSYLIINNMLAETSKNNEWSLDFTQIDGSNYYYCNIVSAGCTHKNRQRVNIAGGSFEISYDVQDSNERNCLFNGAGSRVQIRVRIIGERIYPTNSMYLEAVQRQQEKTIADENREWTGTGFAIGNSYIVTNNHVAEDAKTISVKGVKGDMNTGYTAEVVATDKINDIAILRISDSRFAGFGTIPYAVQQRMADVGEDIFVLGYPLTQALGNEIKLTNGIVSSRTGYQGNISTYQMSAPVQPGNSGGPMFDNKGNVIGIVVAGVPGAENVGYAIKTSYLKILIESAGLNIQFPSNNTISALSLAEKVKRVRNFVFYIECSK